MAGVTGILRQCEKDWEKLDIMSRASAIPALGWQMEAEDVKRVSNRKGEREAGWLMTDRQEGKEGSEKKRRHCLEWTDTRKGGQEGAEACRLLLGSPGTFSTAGSMPGNTGILCGWLTGVLSTLGGSSSDSSLLGDFSSIKKSILSHWWPLPHPCTRTQTLIAHFEQLGMSPEDYFLLTLFFKLCHLLGNSGHRPTAPLWLLPLWRSHP